MKTISRPMNFVVPFFRIIIVDYKSGPHIIRLVDALMSQTDQDFEVVIVDNACPEGGARALTLTDKRFTILTSPVNIGFGGGCNLGAIGCEAPWLMMLNPDTVPARNFVESVKEAIGKYPDAGIFGGTLIDASQPNILDGFGDALSVFGAAWSGGTGQSVDNLPDDDKIVFSVCAAAGIYNRRLYVDIGGFDERFFCYLEDLDICWRANILGAQIIQLVDSRCKHVRSYSTKDDSGFREFHSARNVLWLYAKNSPLLYLPFLLAATFGASVYLTIRGSYAGARGERWRGLISGLVGLWRYIPSRIGTRKNRREQYKRLSFSISELRERVILSTPIPKSEK